MIGVYEHSHASVRWFLFGFLSLPFRLSSSLRFFPCDYFRQFRAYLSVSFDSPLTAFTEHDISATFSLFVTFSQGVDALHRMIWHDMALADDTQPLSTIGSR